MQIATKDTNQQSEQAMNSKEKHKGKYSPGKNRKLALKKSLNHVSMYLSILFDSMYFFIIGERR